MTSVDDAYEPPSAQRSRAFRFSLQASHTVDAASLRPLARKAEDLGVSILTVADHLDDQLSPMVALMAAADATTTLRVGSLVFANDYRNPVLLAKEAATLDQLSGGRFELGLGAGWMRVDYEGLGIPMDSPGVRIERLDESLGLIKSLWSGETITHAGANYCVSDLRCAPLPVQKPGPPIWVGGGGLKVLAVAGRHADVVHLNPSLAAGVLDHRVGPTATAESTLEKLAVVSQHAGERFAGMEIGVRIHLALVTQDRDSIVEAMASGFGLTTQQARNSPHALCGTVEQIAEDLRERRERFGISNIGLSAAALDDMAPVIALLAGT